MSYSPKYQFFLTSTFGTREVFPDIKAVKETWQQEKEERIGYRHQFSGKLVLTGADFDWLLQLENTPLRCDDISLLIRKRCGNVYSDYFTGRVRLNSGDWDLNVCKVAVEIETLDEYTCLDDKGDEEFDAFSLVFARVTALLAPGIVEKTTCTIGTDCPVTGDGWTWYKRTYTLNESMEEVGTDHYARYQVSVGVYRAAQLYNYKRVEYSATTGYYGYDIMGDVIDEVDNGMSLSTLLTELVAALCPSLTVVSNFFQINPTTVSTTNYVTGEASKVLNLVLFQKSDVKRPDAADNASKAPITFNKLMQALYTFFQVKYEVTGSTLNIEHVSYGADTLGLDLTADRYAQYMFHKEKYSYDRSKMPKYERFKTMEARYADFVGSPIVYSGSCVVTNGTGSEKSYEAGDFTTDVLHVLDNPSSNSEVVADAGFVLMALDADNRVLSEDGILTPVTIINNTLAFAQLHRDYWRHNRVLNIGTMNEVEQLFISAIPTKKQVRVSIPFCCGDSFNPKHLQTTSLGDGKVDRAEFNLQSEILELDLLHQPALAYLLPCPIMDIDATYYTIPFSFTPNENATKYTVELLEDGVVIDSFTFNGPFTGTETLGDTFTGLDLNGAYDVRVKVENEDEEYIRICASERIYTQDMPCPTISITPHIGRLSYAVDSVFADADQVKVLLYKDSVEVANDVYTSPFTLPLEDEFTGLIPGATYEVVIQITKGAYTKTCPATEATVDAANVYRLILSTGSATCGGTFADYYGIPDTFGVGLTIFLNPTLTTAATGFTHAIEETSLLIYTVNSGNGEVLTNTGITC